MTTLWSWICLLAFVKSAWGGDSDVFVVGDQQLLLPGVPSRLNFDYAPTSGNENDTRAQVELRKTRFWGRMYIEGWPQPIQYFMAHFASEPPMGPRPVVLADPEDACEPLFNAEAIRNSSAIVMVKRGVCTFGHKAHMAHASGASAIVYVNNQPGVIHAPGPDAHDIEIAAVMISQIEGELLWRTVASEGVAPVARLIPIYCASVSVNTCEPTTQAERDHVHHEQVMGGLVSIHGRPERFEYLLAHFGTWTRPRAALPLVHTEPADACSPLDHPLDGRFAFVHRGNCSFLEKALNVQQVGGAGIVVANNEPTLVRVGVEPRAAGLNVTIPVLMVTFGAGAAMMSALAVQGNSKVFVNLEPHIDVQANVWDELSALQHKKTWPRFPKKARQKYLEVLRKVEGWDEREEALRLAFMQVDPTLFGAEEL